MKQLFFFILLLLPNVYENLEDTSRLLKFIPIFSNDSKKTYLSWGYTPAELQNGISQKKYMDDYVGKETRDKLLNVFNQ